MKLDLANINPQNFEEIALNIFRFQAEHIPVYKEYLQHIDIDVATIKQVKDIPFLPISFFKTHRVFNQNKTEKIIFTSSGTTGINTSKHYLAEPSIYEDSFRKNFEKNYGDIQQYCIIALLPSYLEREGSSLIYMSQKLIEWSRHSHSGFYLDEYEKLSLLLLELERSQQKTILLGVSYALLDLVERYQFQLKNTIVIETGGMKGQRKEMIKEEFYKILSSGFGLRHIHSEYGMTELLSQAYSKQEGAFFTPPWLQILIRDVNDPFCFVKDGKSGGINIIDLANIDSCCFIATQDLGKINPNGSFSVLGRFDNSDIRGCNLLIS